MTPVFIIGCQRSGSTMLGAMLGAHHDMVCLPEAQFIGEFAPPHPGVSLDARALLDRIERSWRFRLWGFDLAGARPSGEAVPMRFAEVIEWLVARYAEHVGKPLAGVWIEQQPGHVQRVHHLASHFAEARFLHLIRDGRAVAASLMACDWGPNRILAAAKYWQERIALGLAAETAFGPTRVRRVTYEDLVAQPETQLRRIAEWIGVDYEPAMVHPTGIDMSAFASFDHGLVGRPIEAKRASDWTDRLSPRAIEIFEAQTGDLLPLMGYRLICSEPPQPARGVEKLRLLVEDQLLRWSNAHRFERRRRKQLRAPQHPPIRPAGNEMT